MLRLPASLQNLLRLIGSDFGSGERLIAALALVWTFVGDYPTPETHGGADQAERTK